MAPFDAASPTTWLSAGRTPVLAVTSEPPWPLDSGGHLRTFHLLRALASRFDVRLVTPARGTDAESAASALAGEAVRPRIVRAARRSAAAEAVRVAVAAARREPYVMFSRHRSMAVAATLRDEMRRQMPQVLYLDHLDSLIYARVRGSAAVIVDMHNVYSRLAGRAAAEASGALRRCYLRRETALLARMERR
ncbi:MAG TPA: hypothetical protein VKD69_16890, partial [Vicinamibacterales bacterium]|nr:hypothetical protein [Vicinamibacterales bacterium]